MLRTIVWALGNLPLLIGLVTAAISVVEALGIYLKEGSETKKARAIALLRDNLDTYLTLPDFVSAHLDALLGILIDAVVLILNLTRGKDWGAKVEEEVAVAVESVVPLEAIAEPERPNPRADLDAKLDELQAKLSRE